jgi:hypothetical protein
MFRVICKNYECVNKNKIYYFIEIMDTITCGGCEKNIVAVEMSQQEYNDVFDYDPYAKPTFSIE